ncbi:4-hydroxy-tetrahydrodipicolinate reductase [Flavipsychrobacter stenotrophus]|uniref:4-hydroxy-tetrahydrodipicolinate reductase n=1 Tax=Flavipsychrobacter stenotrophus TaxID=2077091 RepID=A0A2S7SVD0_9BACT|nr:4-hydroxy-tetrahydrodipicolinate reductase [Flavipsychrobacter stenotrophus]PQJ10853.1 4-hydroxy-tetrahydrodipicolinate reductase [Flavipsychrobacter stenotrophus]
MNIALIGYGKMGQAIEEIAIKRGHNIALCIRSGNRHELDATHMQGVDVAIEFTGPETAKDNVMDCMALGVPVICGSTGWNEEVPEAAAMANDRGVGFLQASNFSIGVNIFFEVNKQLAALMNKHPEYDVSVEETHHTQKKDAPSGTAITIAEQILERSATKKTWALNFVNNENILPIVAHRIENVPGTHRVKYASAIDDIELVHTAHSREGFALGAVLAAEFLAGKKGVFTMRDVLFNGSIA